MEAVPVALALARSYAAGSEGVEAVTPAVVNTLCLEIDRMHELERLLRAEMRDEQREFQREAREIAADARYEERTRNGDGGY